MACGDVLSLEDLQTAKKHQIFEAEVITGRAGGVSTGADIDYATNQVTGQTQKTLPAVLRDTGFQPAPFDFVTGGTLTAGDRNRTVFNPAPSGDSNWYAWQGPLPKVVPAGSTPATSGGLGDGAWKPVTNNILAPTVRESIRRSYAEAGHNLVQGSFQAGFTLANENDVALDEASGKAYSGAAGNYPAGTPTSSFVDKSGALLRAAALSGIYKNWKEQLACVGINLAAGSFEEGAATTTPNSAVMHYGTGTPYMLKTGANANVPAGGSPSSDWVPVRVLEPLPVVKDSLVAHRGLTPENTIMAIGSCHRLGFDAVETDAKQSADGVWYIFHDDSVDNLTNGTGVFSSLQSSYINTLRFDSLAGGNFANEPIPLVTDFIRYALIQGLTVYLEIKSYLTLADVAQLVTTVEGYNAGAGLVLCSMDISVLRHIRFTLGSDIPLQYVYEGVDYTLGVNSAASLQRASFSYFNNLLRQNPQVVGLCARYNISLFAWTILNKKTADQCARLGATNIISDIVL